MMAYGSIAKEEQDLSFGLTTNQGHWLDTKKSWLQKDAARKKLFKQTTTQQKIVCLEKKLIPPSKNNNGPSLMLISVGANTALITCCNLHFVQSYLDNGVMTTAKRRFLSFVFACLF